MSCLERSVIGRTLLVSLISTTWCLAAAQSSPATEPATTTASQPTSIAMPKTLPLNVAYIRMTGEVLERPPTFSLLPSETFQKTSVDWLQRLAKARNDESIAAVAIEIDNIQVSWAQAQEFADAIRRLTEVKPVYTFITEPSGGEYLLAAAGSEAALDPAGTLEIVGLGAELTYFRGTLDKLGLKAQMIQAGKFKGAQEPLTQTQPSDEVKAMYGWLLDDLYDQLCGGIATFRQLDKKDVSTAIDNGPIAPEDALKARLVDVLVSRAQWRGHLEKSVAKENRTVRFIERYGLADMPRPDMSNPFAMLGQLFRGPSQEQPADPSIAIVCADGVITSGRSGESFWGGNVLGDRSFADLMESIQKDSRYKAVVVRINSPGGSAIASDRMFQAMQACDKVKPVIVSVGSLAASGGYYLAVGGRQIFADPGAIIGSIGVIGGKVAITGLYDKLGITTYEILRGQNAGLETSREWTAREEQVIRRHIERTYQLFLDRVKQGRQDHIKDIDQVAQGRIFTARQAVENGLIDSVGGLRDAVRAAQKTAGIEGPFRTIVLPRSRGLADLLIGPAGDDDDETSATLEASLARRITSIGHQAGVRYLLVLAEMLGREKALTAMPHYLGIRH